MSSLILLFFICHGIVASTNWDYGKHGPNVWKDIEPNCGGQKQSPINIKTQCTEYQTFQPFDLTFAHNQSLKFKLTNNGHTIVGEPPDDELFITGGGLDGNFTFVSFHLHWGPNYNTGSEHQM